MISSQVFIIGLPFLLIVVAAWLSVPRQRGESEVNPWDLFFCWVFFYSLAGGLFGMMDAILFFLDWQASDGGVSGGQYYFYKDLKYTPVSKETWQLAYFLEQLPTGTFRASCVAGIASYYYLTTPLRKKQ